MLWRYQATSSTTLFIHYNDEMPGHRCLLWKASGGDDWIESHRINVRITIAIMKIMMMKIMMMMTMIAIMMFVKVMNLQQVQ